VAIEVTSVQSALEFN